MAEASTPPALRILVARPDRLGDVILSTPVLEVLKRHYPRSHLTLLVREAVADAVRGLPGVDEIMIYDPDGKHAGVGGLFRLISEFRAREFRIGVVLQSKWKIAAALFAAGVRYRVGPLSKIHSFLFYNRGVRQRRSLVEMHETDYNLQLLRRLGIRIGTRSIPVKASVTDAAKAWARDWLIDRGRNPADAEVPLVVVHPGMGGSALNWPENHYIDLIRGLLKDGVSVLVSGGPTEGELHQRIRQKLGDSASKVMFYGGAEATSLDRLAGLLSWSTVMVAPSTGPLHLAVALGKRVVTFYPPIRVQSAIRWGPYIADESRASVLVPEVYCGEDFECRGNLCNYYPCMRSLQPNQALEQVRRQLAQSKVSEASNG